MHELKTSARLTGRELRAGFRGFYVFLFCLVLGVGSIAGVRSLSSDLMHALEQNGKYILGGDIALKTLYRPAPPEQIKFLREEIGPTTVVAETRAMARTEDESKASLVELKAVDVFYPHYGTFDYWDKDGVLQQKSINTSTDLLPHLNKDMSYGEDWGAYIEPELGEVLGVGIGDKIYVGEQLFEIRGIIEKEPDRLGSGHFTYAPRVLISLSSFDRTGLLTKGSQIYYDHKVILFAEEQYEKLGEVQDTIAKAFPDAKWKGRNYFNASPRIERFITQLTAFLTLVGLTSLLVGGIGIGNAVRGYLEQNYANIATFKCLGASKRLIFKIYFYRILFFGLIGTALGCALGALVPPLLTPVLAEKMSLTAYETGIYPFDLILAGIFGMLTVVLFSLYPLGRACEVRAADLFRSLITVTQARVSASVLIGLVITMQLLALLIVLTSSDRGLSIGFILGTVLTVIVFFAASSLIKTAMRMMKAIKNPSLRLAVSNLYRPGNMTNALVLSLGLGLTVFAAISLIQYNFSRKLSDNLSAETPSFFFLDIQQDQVEGFTKSVKALPTARHFQITPQLRGRITSVNGIPAEQALVDEEESWVLHGDRSFTYRRDMPAQSRITSGAWWPENYDGPPLVSISQDVEAAFDITVGDRLTINILGRDITAKVANIREVDWTSFSMNFAVTFAPGTLEGAPATWLATVIVDENQEMTAQSAIAKAFPNISAVRVRDALDLAKRILTTIASAVRIAAALTLAAGMLVLAGALAAGQRRRVYDAVIFKVIGAQRKQILGIFMTEYVVLGIITAVIAAFLGTGAAYLIQGEIIEFDWQFSPMALLSVIIGALAVSILSGFAAGWGILGVRPARYLRNE